jgi:hypothetical protein
MPAIRLVLQSYGREYEYRRALLAILSYFVNGDPSSTHVVLFTDDVAWFERHLGGLPVHYEFLDEHRIRTMRGDIDFVHRMKIAMIDFVTQDGDADILYADSDTFFTASPASLTTQVDEQMVFMHLHEYRFGEIDYPMSGSYGETMNRVVQLLQDGTLLDGTGARFPVSLDDSSWNAGVMMLHRTTAHRLRDVYALTDQIYRASQHHASEQYAFSLVFQRALNIRPCDSVIYHYWYGIKKQICDAYLSCHISEAWTRKTTKEKLEDVKVWIAELPNLFENHPLMTRDRAIQAFHNRRFADGYAWSARLLWSAPRLFLPFVRDIAYFTRIRILGR